ncbi:MAG: phosphorylcholine transferase LicD [Suipraeoptans sp.]
MNKFDLKDFQIKAYEALKELAEIFENNNIRYYLLAGTTLGAVRHKGFIPWDDDIDIGIFCEDKGEAYRVLRENLSKDFKFIDNTSDSSYPRLYGKILYNGYCCVDVFILVKTANNHIHRKLQWYSRKVLFKMFKAKIGYANHRETTNLKARIKVYISRLVSIFFSDKRILDMIDKNEVRFSGINNDYYLNIYSAYGLEQELISSEWLKCPSKVFFVDDYYPTVNDTDAYLKHLYGDYMTLPNEADRIIRHGERFG